VFPFFVRPSNLEYKRVLRYNIRLSHNKITIPASPTTKPPEKKKNFLESDMSHCNTLPPAQDGYADIDLHALDEQLKRALARNEEETRRLQATLKSQQQYDEHIVCPTRNLNKVTACTVSFHRSCPR
jgi:hypothetical protein